MKIKIITMMLAAVACAFIGCKNPNEQPAVKKDAVSIFPDQETIDSEGGSIDIVVTGSGAWTLSGDYDWVVPSVKSGKDGDMVKFTVAANETENDRTAEFTFTVGKAEAKFKLTSKKKGTGPETTTKLDLLTDGDIAITEENTRIEIKLDTDFNYRELENSISESGHEWLSYVITTKAGDVVSMYFDAAANATFEDRTAVVTITGGSAQVEVTVTQKQTDRLTTESLSYYLRLEGGSVDVQVLANVEYDMEVDPAAAWLTVQEKGNDLYTFSGEATDTRRKAEIKFTAKDGALSRTISVIQKGDAAITVAANMIDNRAWPLWHNNTPVSYMSELTIEALVYADEWKTHGNLNTIMGIEDMFLIRTGDATIQNNQIQVCFTQLATFSTKLSNADMRLNAQQWYHIAVTYSRSNQEVKAYIDGVEKGRFDKNSEDYYGDISPVHFGLDHNDENGSYFSRCFWVGYSYDTSRYWPGMLSELRIWNKALTVEEINAENHFYNVDPASDGLVTYWKMNDDVTGTEDVIKDYTSYGNHLTSEQNIEWIPVSLP